MHDILKKTFIAPTHRTRLDHGLSFEYIFLKSKQDFIMVPNLDFSVSMNFIKHWFTHSPITLRNKSVDQIVVLGTDR